MKNILNFYLTSISVRKHERQEICPIYLLTTVKIFTTSSFNLANQNETIYCKVNWYKIRFEIICYCQNLNNLFGYILKIWFLTKIQLFLNNFVWSKTMLLIFFSSRKKHDASMMFEIVLKSKQKMSWSFAKWKRKHEKKRHF